MAVICSNVRLRCLSKEHTLNVIPDIRYLSQELGRADEFSAGETTENLHFKSNFCLPPANLCPQIESFGTLNFVLSYHRNVSPDIRYLSQASVSAHKFFSKPSMSEYINGEII